MEEKEIKELIENGRNFIHGVHDLEGYKTDQELKLPQPPLTKAAVSDIIIDLPINYEELNINNDFLEVINTRKSNRVYTQKNISLLELSYLLWTCQGVKSIRGKSYATLRTVPCGGGRHEFELYMAIQNVDSLEDGYYHYLPMTHQIELLSKSDEIATQNGVSLMGQTWANKANIVFYFSIDCYRVEWRYGVYSHRGAMIDVGHITENIYLACNSIGLGSCAVGAVDGKMMDEILQLDGENEFVFYSHVVGTINKRDIDKEQDFYKFVQEEGL